MSARARPDRARPSSTPIATLGRRPLRRDVRADAARRRASSLVTHGYAEHCGRYREVAHVIVRRRLGRADLRRARPRPVARQARLHRSLRRLPRRPRARSSRARARSRRRAPLVLARPLARQPDHAARAVRAIGRPTPRARSSSSPYLALRSRCPATRSCSRASRAGSRPKLAQPNAAARRGPHARSGEAGRAHRRHAVLRHRDRALVHRGDRRAGLRRATHADRIDVPDDVARRRRRPDLPIRRRARRVADRDDEGRLSRPRRHEARGVQRGRARPGLCRLVTKRARCNGVKAR